MDLGLQDRVALVSGASGGLGLASAIELAREGCRVALCSRSEDRIQAAAEQVRTVAGVEDAGRVLPLVCDVTGEQQILEAVERTVSSFGKLEILITNAGGPPSGFIDDLNSEQWRSAIELNLMSTINLCRQALPHLREAVRRENGLGRILMITSISAKQPIPNLMLSNTARAGVQGFAKSLSEQLGPDGITVNTILPGYTRTDRLKNLSKSIQEQTGKSPAEIEEAWASGTALKRIGLPEEFAAAVAFLVSERAGFITGVALPVDGGTAKGLL
jgi:3-oxoacyl-[acyl-carrier protein] reductase